MNSPKVFIIILNWNGLVDTLNCLSSLQKLDYKNYEVIVVDNGSVDGSPEKISEQFPGLQLIKNKENLGFCEGNNIGIRNALQKDADYIFLLNNDTEIEKNVLSNLVSAMENNLNIGIIGAKIMSYNEPEKVQLVGGDVNLKTGKISPFPLKVHKISNELIETDWVSGCAFFIRSNVIKEIGYLDTKYFAYREEVDYCVRAKNIGYKIASCNVAKVYHNRNKSYSLRELYFKSRNVPYFMIKHAQKRDLITFFMRYYLFWTVYWKIKCAFRDRKIYEALAIVLGLMDFLLMRYGKGSLALISKISADYQKKNKTGE